MLMYAVTSSNQLCVVELLKAGADVLAKDSVRCLEIFKYRVTAFEPLGDFLRLMLEHFEIRFCFMQTGITAIFLATEIYKDDDIAVILARKGTCPVYMFSILFYFYFI